VTIPKRIAAGIAAAALITALGSTTAAHASAPATSPVPCGSSLTWLRLFATTGERCYTGNGTAVVDLTVREMQIVGSHEVCLRLIPPAIVCHFGSGTVFFNPARYVQYVSISTPLPNR
jgi:hypothetical protein